MWAMSEKSAQDSADRENFTFLGKGVDFKGIIHFNATIRIDGKAEGEIRTTGTLIVGEHAVIKGMVSAKTVINYGGGEAAEGSETS